MDGTVDLDDDARRLARLDTAAMRVLVDAGALPGDRRVEMIEGVLIEMAPSNDSHGAALFGATLSIGRLLPPGFRGVTDAALYLAEDLMLAPDIAVLPSGLASQDAGGRDIALIVEISDSTLAYDLGQKALLYAAHGVRDYWVVDLPARQLHIHRSPGPEGYGTVIAQDWASPATALSIPGLSFVPDKVLTS